MFFILYLKCPKLIPSGFFVKLLISCMWCKYSFYPTFTGNALSLFIADIWTSTTTPTSINSGCTQRQIIKLRLSITLARRTPFCTLGTGHPARWPITRRINLCVQQPLPSPFAGLACDFARFSLLIIIQLLCKLARLARIKHFNASFVALVGFFACFLIGRWRG